MDLLTAIQTENTVTENGMTTNSTSSNANVNLFFAIGALRGQPTERLYSLFSKAYAENPLTAMKILFWSRDVRAGAGERQIFRDILLHLATEGHEESVIANLSLIPAFGRWDDLAILFDTKVRENALDLIVEGLNNKDALCAKWMPRPTKNDYANTIRKRMKLSPKEYRKLLVELTDVVETKMCAKDWESIDFSKLPSLASARYQKSFGRNAYERYSAYVQSLKKGETKINAGAVYPYDVIKSITYGDKDVANAQWAALPNWMEGSTERILPVVDVSGSMCAPAGGNSKVTCMDVAVSLGLYISERNVGPFQDSFITFSSDPKLEVVKGTLADRCTQMMRSDWGMNTNVESVFDLILDQAKRFNVSEDQMPTKVLILSDMEFDHANGGRRIWHRGRDSQEGNWNPTVQQMIREKYEDAGYKIPDIIYWNIQSRNDNFPVKYNETGTALISGFSPSILKSIIKGEIVNPYEIMMTTINDQRYDAVTA